MKGIVLAGGARARLGRAPARDLPEWWGRVRSEATRATDALRLTGASRAAIAPRL